ncbi:MAG: FAD-dependent oxidoreductase [Verrucomicrobia bacterium]|nr:FAD-dependent oxidoreductase [Verrucomicrobiota bacterium]
MDRRILIIGGGPTGCGAARRLVQRGHTNWHLYERDSVLGGLAGSRTDEHAFTWDIGGHVIFSHFKEFDALVDDMLGNEMLSHERESWIRILGTWVPYPFQNNIRHLPAEALLECLMGLIEVHATERSTADFHQFIRTTFGRGIGRYFMEPYNFKVWATHPSEMSAAWIAERVSVVDIERVLRNVITQHDDVAWGPNNLFRFPLRGGTGEIYRRFGRTIEAKTTLNAEVVEIDTARKRVKLDSGETDPYDVLISTMPLNALAARLHPKRGDLVEAAAKLRSNSALIVGLGVERPVDNKRCWMYFPEDNCPFYRTTNFSNYSYNNVPYGDVARYHSLMCETSFSDIKPRPSDMVRATLDGAISAGLLTDNDRPRIVDEFLIEVPQAYPVPTRDRDTALATLQPELEQLGIMSRGRFGAWRYEIGNMDHSFMQGWQAIDHVFDGAAEDVFLKWK